MTERTYALAQVRELMRIAYEEGIQVGQTPNVGWVEVMSRVDALLAEQAGPAPNDLVARQQGE